MGEWKEIQKVHEKREIKGIMGITILFFAGIICDLNVLFGRHILIPVNDIESFSLTVLQIQATITTLIFTIIALITGNISESYMGVSINDFNLNIKPWKLTQKKLIVISFVLCLLAMISHSLRFYNMVIYLLIATLIVILISIENIYSVFEGRNRQNIEIEAYFNYVLESNIKFEKKLSLFQNFVLDWKKDVVLQDKQSYEKSLEIFKKSMLVLWNYRTDDVVLSIRQQCYNISYCLLGSEKKALKEKGIEFVQEVYDVMWDVIKNCIEEEKPIVNQYKNEFPLFTEISRELTQSIDEINVEDLEKRLRFQTLADSVLRCAIWFKYDGDKEVYNEDGEIRFRGYKYDYQSEISEMNFFALRIGSYLRKQNQKGNIINQAVWADVLNGWFLFSSHHIPEERIEDFLKVKVNTYFCYCYGMLMHGQEEIVKAGLYFGGMKYGFRLENKHHALLYLVVHSYVYYLAVRESDDCVSRETRQSALNIWEDSDVKNAFWHFLHRLSEKPEWLDLDAVAEMNEILDRFELFPRYSSSKFMIIESTILEFYLFLILFMSRRFFLPELLDRNIDDVKMFEYVSYQNEKKTKEIFGELFRMLSKDQKSDDEINREIDLMYNDLEKIMKKKQKDRYIRLAKEAQENYKSKISENDVCSEIKNDVVKILKETFSPILVERDEKNGIIKIPILKLTTYTEMGFKEDISGFYSRMIDGFLFGVADYLVQRKVVDFKNRFHDFADDIEFIKYLQENNLNLFFGSQFIFKNRDYKTSAEYKKFFEKYETVYTTGLQNGIALKRDSIQVCLHDINVSIHSPGRREIKVIYDKETKKYSYRPISNGLAIEFEEDELNEFLYNYHKVINITAKISIQVNETPCGTIF